MFKILILTIIASLLNGQSSSIKGKILDKKTKEPLISVNIQIEGTSMGTVTDIDGLFLLSNLEANTYILSISYLGYKSQKLSDIVVRTAKATELLIEMEEDVFSGDEVLVQGSYFVETQNLETSKISLSKEEIRRYPGGFEDVVRTVSSLPGVAINTQGGRNDLIVRGGGPTENLFIINGLEIPNINHFGTQGASSGTISFLNLDFVRNVDFSTGGFPSRYGDKMSSVVNLELDRGRNDKIGYKTTLSATSLGLQIEGPLFEKSDFIFSARQSYLDIIFKANGFPFVPVYTDYNLIGNFDITDKDKLFILGLAAINRTEKNNEDLEKRTFNANILNQSLDQYIVGLRYRHLIKKGYFDLSLNRNMYSYNFSQDDENLDIYFKSRSQENETILKSQLFFEASKSIYLSVGASFKWIDNESQSLFADSVYDRNGNKVQKEAIGILSNTLSSNSAVNSFALFVESEFALSQAFSLKGGLRWDHYNFINQKDYFSPRLQAKYELSSDLNVKANYGVYYQAPSYVWLTNPNNRDLLALRNHMSILGFEYLPKNDIKVSVESYYKKYDQLPSGQSSNINDYLVLNNTGVGFPGRRNDFQSFGFFNLNSNAYGNAYGIELLIQKKYSETPYYGLLSLTYGKSEYTANNGQTYPGEFDQRWIFNLNAGYKLNEKWEFSGKFRYFTGQPYTPVRDPATNGGKIQNLPNDYLTGRLNPRHALDIRVDRYFNYDSWTLITFIDIQNATNYKGKTLPRYDFWKKEIVDTPSLGILPTIGISAEF